MDPKRLRLLIIGAIVVAVLGFGYALYSALQKESQQERWDVLDKLRKDGEPDADPIWQNPYGVYNPERVAYIRRLETFLDKTAKSSGDALEPQTRYVIAKTLADHILSNPGILDREERGALYKQALGHLETIRDQFPDFPLNWTMLSDEGRSSLTRQFIQWFEANQKWEQEYMLQAREPAADVRIVVRTDRGDMLVGLYTDLAPKWTANFMQRAIAGAYDDTSFYEKREIGDVSEPEDHTVRAGGAMTRGMQPFDMAGHKKVAGTKLRSGHLPEEARNTIPHTFGILSAWHDASDEYDNDEQFVLCAAASPLLDYKYTPVGKLLDTDGFKSTETLRRIFAGAVWRDDKAVRDSADEKDILDVFQAPPKIIKVLVFTGGALQEPTEGGLPTRAKVEDKERALSSIEVDRYKTDAPKPPAKDGDDKKDDDKKDADGEQPPVKGDDEGK